jgi:hypothetical protein
MATDIARRIQWLFPVEREVYRTWRAVAVRSGEVYEGRRYGCVRCGSHVRTGDVGYSTRERGSSFMKKEVGFIHRRCVPTPDFTTAGLPARRVRRA